MGRSNKINVDLYKSEFPTRLRTLLSEEKISYKALGDAIGTTYQSISSYCDGKSMPTLQNAQAIADFFDVSLDYLTGRSNVKSRDAEIQTIHDKIGLSESAIKKLSKFDERKARGEANKFAASTIRNQICGFYSSFIENRDISTFLFCEIGEYEQYRRGKLSEPEADVFEDAKEAMSFWEFKLQQNILRFIKGFISDLDCILIAEDLKEKEEG